MKTVAIAAVIVVIAAACGGDSESGAADESTTAAADEATTAENEPEPEPEAEAETETEPAEEAAPTAALSVRPTDPIDLAGYQWASVVDGAPWGGRAGLRVLEVDGALFVLGGRTPRDSAIPGDSDIFGDVWQSDDGGVTWTEINDGLQPDHWPARAYFQAVVKDGEMLVIGGQDFGLMENPFCALLEQGLEPPPGLGIDPDAPCPEFLPTSQFFNDVWASSDGVSWEQRTAAAPWSGRAGLSAVVAGDFIYVMGGSQNDDTSIIGPSGPQRIYYNDVWRSTDGVDWEQMTDAAPWAERAGASVVALDDEIWLFGGEVGFTCDPLPDCEPPYFNDVWRSLDGAEWELVSESAAWSPRPGHQCEVVRGGFVCFGGFGLIENPIDVWSTPNGVDWTLVEGGPWNAATSEQARYDFDSITIGAPGEEQILTVGGDRETFDFEDPENWKRVDDDVWTFGLG